MGILNCLLTTASHPIFIMTTEMSEQLVKILTTSQTKNTQARQTSGFGIFTSPRTILLASDHRLLTSLTFYILDVFSYIPYHFEFYLWKDLL
jgi:hypothetical protein